MQDYDYDEYDPVDETPSRFSRVKGAVSTAIGALVAMALLMTLGIWFYRLGVRDAQNVPIIRAAVEPAKTRPEDPGGMVAPHQDVTSYGVADSQGVQAGVAVIAPPPPEPKEEDLAMGQLAAEEAPIAPTRPSGQSGTRTAALDTVSTDELLKEAEKLAAEARVSAGTAAATDLSSDTSLSTDAGAAQEEPEAQELALAPTDTETQSDLVQTLPLAVPNEDEAEAEAEAATPESEPEEEEVELSFPNADPQAPAKSPMARKRPTDLKTRVAEAAKVEEASTENLAAAAAQSKVQIQLAADPSETVVMTMWQAIQRANSDILHDRALAVQTTNSGGTTYYRLRVGPFKDGAEARSVCQALKARGQDCIVARNS